METLKGQLEMRYCDDCQLPLAECEEQEPACQGDMEREFRRQMREQMKEWIRETIDLDSWAE